MDLLQRPPKVARGTSRRARSGALHGVPLRRRRRRRGECDARLLRAQARAKSKKIPADEPIGRERESPNLHSESPRKRTDTTHRAPCESETRVHNSGARIVSRETILGLAERDLHRLVAHFLRVRFPTVLVLNKMDAAGARAHADAIKRRFPREPTAETVATTREGTRAALRDAVRLKPPALAFPTDELPAAVFNRRGGGGGRRVRPAVQSRRRTVQSRRRRVPIIRRRRVLIISRRRVLIRRRRVRSRTGRCAIAS